ncbi:MAG: T9SS type A sorting domain-containing protein, partial [Muribaculaceae bacterium]|nr:T9SS type A sorting domain-containing protein [Muribaculaceae bacterium]
ENLRQAEVFNMLGQLVLTALGKGNGIYIDMTDLPAGVYFVDVTDEEGRKCVRKVVKE